MSILKIENLDYYYNDGDNKRYILKNMLSPLCVLAALDYYH